MKDAPPKKRPWFQLHLSTCVVLMFVAGAFLWANHRVQFLRKTTTESPVLVQLGTPDLTDTFVEFEHGFGWPLVFEVVHADSKTAEKYAWVYPSPELYRPEKEPPPAKQLFDLPDDEAEKYFSGPYVNTVPAIQWSWSNLVINFILATALSGIAALGLELAIRRRERKRAAQEPAP